MRTGRHCATRPGAWGHLDFRRLWVAETVSQFGSVISELALPLVAILLVHASTFEVGLLSACETVPFLLVGLPAGAWVDRLPIRAVLICADLVRALALGSIPLAAAIHTVTVGQLFVVALVTGAGTVFFSVAYQSYLPELIDRDDLVDGNAKLQISESVSQIAGPGVGGFLIQWITAPYAVFVDALTFLWSAVWVARIDHRTPPARSAQRDNLMREIGAGVRFVMGNRLLRAIVACTGTSNLFYGMSMAVYYILLARQLHLSAGLIGVIAAVGSIGALFASVFAERIRRLLGVGRSIWVPILLAAGPAFVIPFVHRDWTLVLLAAGQVVYAACIVTYNIAQVSLRQALCPPELLGRMNATVRCVVWGTLPVGGVLGGVLGTLLGVRQTLVVAAFGAAVAFLPVFFSPLRTLREVPTYIVPNDEISNPLVGT